MIQWLQLKNGNWAAAQKGCKGPFTEEGIIEGTIPQYIKEETDPTFIEVTDLTYLLYNCTELKAMPKIPTTVRIMNNTFLECNNLVETTTIPNSVIDMTNTFSECTNLKTVFNIPESAKILSGTFFDCSSLTKIPNIPNSVVELGFTFFGCTSLTSIPNIPNRVENKEQTFYNCTSLTTVPEIPSSVTNMRETFSGCSSLNGTITINANLSGAIISGDKNDYYAIFWNSATAEGCEIKLTGTCPMLENIVQNTNRSNITLL